MERSRGAARRRVSFCLVLLGLIWPHASRAADLKEAQAQFLSGNYTRCVTTAQKAVQDSPDNEDWQVLLSQALLATGRYAEALAAMTNALARDRWGLRVRWQAREVFLCNGQPEAAGSAVDDIVRFFTRHPEDYREAPALVAFARAALLRKGDPKRVLDRLLDTAKKADPKLRDVYLAGGDLALDKHDYALAAKWFDEGLKQLPDDPDLHCGLARAFAPSDAALVGSELETALERNSNHVGSLLLLAEHQLDAEDYEEAATLLERIKAVNPWHPDAWAFRAVLAHLQNEPEQETAARQAALKFWPGNPRVDHLIGLKLSQNYRFAEGAAHQRQALAFDADYLPAKAQLAQDLLRLGEEADGWRLAEEVHKQDAYDVQAYNLVTLQDTMGKFATIRDRDFLVRMNTQESRLYGMQLLELLQRARTNLCAKYGIEVKRPTIVEVFTEQKDFAVRTFGMPGDPGYLGVCFGSVITANGPATHRGSAVNWEAVLWHEFCHVVTLQMTRNKMPRWLSEGISVYEERLANPAWGQRMTPRYREMVLGDDLTPISQLSGAFLAPPSPVHLQFAYFESSLAVEFLVERFGLDKLKAILRDLGEGLEINQAIAKNSAPMAELEKAFAAFARQRAEQLAPGLDWERPGPKPQPASRRITRRLGPPGPGPATNAPALSLAPQMDPETWKKWAEAHPTNFWVMTRQADELVEAKDWLAARPRLQELVEVYPDFTGPDSPYRGLAAAHRALGETNAERQVLERFAAKDDEAPDAYGRLMELAAAQKDWAGVARNAERYLAVNPLVPLPYRFLAQASEETGETRAGIRAYRALLELEPPDPADVHFHLAQLLYRVGDPEARRQVLQALEEAPRYPAALRLLLELNRPAPPAATSPTAAADGR